MNASILEILSSINNAGFQSYVVGGYTRDNILGRKTSDIDITTNAKPKELAILFPGAVISEEDYGSVKITTSKYNYEITTFRKELSYQKRIPKIEYVNDLTVDLKRRDFTMNTICMDQNGKIIDLFNGLEDINNKKIKMVGNSYEKLKEDPLRILRAIRFATILNFNLDKDLYKAIIKNKNLLKDLSDYRIRSELDLILSSPSYYKGLYLLDKTGMKKVLNLKYKKVVFTEDICGMWSQIESNLVFTKKEKDAMAIIRNILKNKSINNNTVYKYGLYLNIVAGTILGITKEKTNMIFNNLPIQSKKDINIEYSDILNIAKKDKKICGEIYNQIEYLILNNKLNNKKDDIIKFIRK